MCLCFQWNVIMLWYLGSVFSDLPQIHTKGHECQEVKSSTILFFLSNSKSAIWGSFHTKSSQLKYSTLLETEPQVSVLECDESEVSALLSVSWLHSELGKRKSDFHTFILQGVKTVIFSDLPQIGLLGSWHRRAHTSFCHITHQSRDPRPTISSQLLYMISSSFITRKV